jgi:hypothetical protein
MPGWRSRAPHDLLAFLTKPAAPSRQRRARRFEGVGNRRIRMAITPPPSRNKTGYGNAPYVITPPWEFDCRLRSAFPPSTKSMANSTCY